MFDSTKIIKEIQEEFHIIGRSIELEKIILARSVEKNILIEGEVGVGKTRIAKAVANYYDSDLGIS